MTTLPFFFQNRIFNHTVLARFQTDETLYFLDDSLVLLLNVLLRADFKSSAVFEGVEDVDILILL